MDNGRNQSEYSSNWLSKFNQRHRESQDSGPSSPSYSRNLNNQSPTPISSDDGIDMIIDSHVIDDETQIIRDQKTPEKDEWTTVPKKAVRTGNTPTVSTFCP